MADQAQAAPVVAPAQTTNAPANTPEPVQADAPKTPEYVEIKVNGQVRKLTPEQLRAFASKGMGADEKFEEAARIRKEREQFEDMLERNPRMFIEKKLGKDKANKMYQEALYEAIMAERMTPEQRQMLEEKKALELEKHEIENWKKDQEKSQLENMEKHYLAEYDKSISSAIASSGLPKTARTVRRMTELMLKNLDNEIDLSADDVVQLVKEDYIKEFQEMFGSAEGDAIAEIFGDGPYQKLRKRDLARLSSVGNKSSGVEVKAVDNNATSGQASGDGKALTMDEWEEMMEKRKQALTD